MKKKSNLLYIITILLAVMLTLQFSASAEWVNIIAADGDSAYGYALLSNDDSIGIQFNATSEFARLGIMSASWSDNLGDLTLSLYRWSDGYLGTLAGEPVCVTLLKNAPDNSDAIFDVGTQPAGEYLALITTPDYTLSVGVWVRTNTKTPSTRLYISGAESVGNAPYSFYIDYTTVPQTTYGALSPVSGEHTVSKAFITYDPSQEANKSPIIVPAGSVYGQRVKTTQPVAAADFCMPTWGEKESQTTLGVFAWKGTYWATVSEKPIFEQRFDTLIDCAVNKITFPELPAGEYFFAIYDTKGAVGIWRFPSDVSCGYVYMDGDEGKYDLQMTLYPSKAVAALFDECKSVFEVEGDPAVPERFNPDNSNVLNTRNAYPDTWVYTDALGRTSEVQTGVKTDKERAVGVFYWDCHYQFAQYEPFNLNDFMLKNPDAKNDFKSSVWPLETRIYFWNEPIYGYYRTTDKWVIRKQAELLAAAGVDVIFFDNTNGNFTWANGYRTVFDVFSQARADGVMAPAISFLLPFGPSEGSREQLRSIYLDIFRTGKYSDLYFWWENKPLILAYTDNLDPNDKIDTEILNYFTFRSGQPKYSGFDYTKLSWGWLSTFPQDRYLGAKNRTIIEEMTVSPAQNASEQYPLGTAMNGEGVFGRSYTSKDKYAHYSEKDSVLYGYNYAEQWDYAIEIDPKLVFITGWNEWTASRHESWGNVKNAFPDQFNDEYSRDIEPTKGQLKDNYYYQTVSFIRKYKGATQIPAPGAYKTIDINSDTDMWADVSPYYVAYSGNTENRDSAGYGSYYYKDESGRNDIIGSCIARDNDNIYIMVECSDELTEPGENWMVIYLDTVNNGLDGWESFDYVINKSPVRDNKAVLERFNGDGYESTEVGTCEFSVQGNRLQIKVPKALLNITSGDFTVNFKVTDNVETDGDIMDFYSLGDVAPLGRFKYSYISTSQTSQQTEIPSTEAPGSGTASSGQHGTDDITNKAPVYIAAAAALLLVIAAVTVVVIKKRK